MQLQEEAVLPSGGKGIPGENKETVAGWGAELVDIGGINEEGLLVKPADVEKAVKVFKDADVDGIFIANCNFGEESVAAMDCKRT